MQTTPPKAKQTNIPGPSNSSLLTVTRSQPLAKSYYTSLTLNAHSPLALKAFSVVLWLSLGFPFSLGLPSKCLEHSRSRQTSGLWLQHLTCDNHPEPPILSTTSLITSHQPTSPCNVSVATLRFPKRHSERNSTPSLSALFSPCYRNRGSGEFWGHCPDLWDSSLNLIVNCCSTYRVKPKLNKGSRNTCTSFTSVPREVVKRAKESWGPITGLGASVGDIRQFIWAFGTKTDQESGLASAK